MPMADSPHFQQYFTASDFRARHQRIFDEIGPHAAAVLQGAPPVGGFEIFRQTNEFFYLCGVETPLAYLLLDARTRNVTLYLPPHDPHHAAPEGDEPSPDDAAWLIAHTGVTAVANLAQLTHDLHGLTTLVTPHAPAETNMTCRDTLSKAAAAVAKDPWHNHPSRESAFIQKLHHHLPKAQIQDLSPILDHMRLIKDASELSVMRQAGHLTAQAVTAAMRTTRPGLFEYHLGAVAEYLYRSAGARGAAYRPIIATGQNIWMIHYYRNNAQLQDGDLILMDVAPDLANYTSDIGRMWPVNGRYSDLQRQLYGFIVALHQAILHHLRPGVLGTQILAEAREQVRPLVNKMKFQNPHHEAGVRKALESDNHLTHPVGMAVHDAGNYKNAPLQPGLVFALDPQLWIPDEKIYIRVEDTVAITNTGVENLTAAAPLELDEVESLMRSTPNGMLQLFPPTELA